MNNKEGKEILSNMIKVADLTKRIYEWRYIYCNEPRTVMHEQIILRFLRTKVMLLE